MDIIVCFTHSTMPLSIPPNLGTQTKPSCNHSACHDAPDPAETDSELEADIEKEFWRLKGNRLGSIIAEYVQAWDAVCQEIGPSDLVIVIGRDL